MTDPKQRLFRYGVQVNSLGLTEQQPENNVSRILIEMLAVTLSKNARARAVQLPAWNEALGLPRPWDQQWSLRMQQILAYETDLLEYDDIFDGSPAIAAKVAELKARGEGGARAYRGDGRRGRGGRAGYMKRSSSSSNTRRVEAIERGEQTVVGVNRFMESEPSPLAGAADAHPDRFAAGRGRADRAAQGLARRARPGSGRGGARGAARGGREKTATSCRPSIACAKAGVTTGEWGVALRESFGEYRAPTGVGRAPRNDTDGLDDLRADVERVSRKLGRRLKFVVGKPGLDGHSNGAEQIAVRARDAGMDVVYEGIRLTPAEIVAAARAQEARTWSGSRYCRARTCRWCKDVVARMKSAGLDDVPVVVGGIIPPEDASALQQAGVAAVYTPKDFELNRIMADIVRIVDRTAA